ncbi:hypothetical protein AVEN_95148-1 [Araneus ventricosus]|uniref:Uncharacterized protein n=1 Tax=Araneus ventricosus TaxID=182803 RepID=A0A4Y2W0B7_ARAVE|nr:hypothetical protein AVEN_188633-1 [Araneus ventricosus]GBO29965.1 hypothetical protein AVEN_229194-1 [Araneus ventricosus]GBO29966.1 hypothetical protein AVEN_229894-1 [Araneus ventricosus]GBO29970.1 hypothetical protein AVEN_95148-1 [Araneus ventricosus]
MHTDGRTTFSHTELYICNFRVKAVCLILSFLPVNQGIHKKASYAICPKTGFPPHILVEKLDKAFTNVPKFVLGQGLKSQNSCQQDSSSPSSNCISSLDARCQCRQILCFASTLASR